MGLYFDVDFAQLLRIGDIDGAIALLTKKYPHLKKDQVRQSRYIEIYSARF